MNRVLGKRILRDIKENFRRWLALFLMTAMGMYIVVSMVGSAENIIEGSRISAENNLVESGEFSVFIPLTEENENDLRNLGITLERKFSTDFSLEDNSVLRLMKNRAEINLTVLDEGRTAEKKGEVVLEKRYCEEHGYSVGDEIEIAGRTFVITGIGTTPDYDMMIAGFSDMSVDSTLFGTAFVTSEQYEEILSEGNSKAEDLTYAYRLGGGVTDEEVKQAVKNLDFNYRDIEDEFFHEMIADAIEKKEELQSGITELSDGAAALRDALEALDENAFAVAAPDEYLAGVNAAYNGSVGLAEGADKLKTETDILLDELFDIDIDNLTMFVTADENPRILAAAGDMVMNKEMGLLAGVVVMALFAYVISVFVIHQISRESSVIGALYALGAKKKSLLLHYITLPAAVTFFGGLLGAAIGFSDAGIKAQEADVYAYYSIPVFDTIYPLYLIIYSVIMPPLISVIVNSLVINKRLSQTALSLMRNEQRTSNLRGVSLKGGDFVRNFRIRQIMREIRTGITVIVGMLISLLILMLGLNCLALCENIKTDSVNSTKFEYMYMMKYPEETVPKAGEPCYVETLSKTEWGYTLSVTVIGIDSENKYFDVQPESGKSSLVIGKSLAEKYSLSIGDKLILTDSANETDYVFTVKDICGYSSGLTAFMNIDGMRELFGQKEDYYNMLLSDEALDIDESRIYSVTSRSDVERSSSVFTELMMPMILVLVFVSAIIFFVVMYLMLGVMIERSGYGISLLKIFGYRTKEIRRLYLSGNLVITAVGAIICIPLSKAAVNAVYPWAVANIACGINLRFEWYIYLFVFLGIMLVYFAVSALLVRKINGITPAEVLKNRE